MPALPKDATIRTVWPYLVNQQNYVGTIYHKLKLCALENGNAHVRIGVTGSGQKPCYRIFWMQDGSEHIEGSYWDQHDPLDVEDAINQNWSSAAMSFDELDDFFRREKNWPKRGP